MDIKNLTEQELGEMYEELDLSDEAVRKLKQEYGSMWKLVLAEIITLNDDLLPTVSLVDVESKLPTVYAEIDRKVDESFDSMDKLILLYLTVMYSNSVHVFTPDIQLVEFVVNATVNSAWAKDALTVSGRLLRHSGKLKQTIKATLYDGLVRKQPFNKIIRQVKQEVNRNFYKVERVIRTEANRSINRGLHFSYDVLGYTHYEYSAILDNRTSETCIDLNGRIFHMSEYQEGYNAPPMHVNCRSTISPVDMSL